MRVAVISDIHANLPALEAVLAEVDAHSPDAIWCLGDLVGYGPNPNECCEIVRRRADICLVGNHDLVALGEIDVEDFNADAKAAALWTRDAISDESATFLRSLEPSAEAEGVQLFHASARDAVWEYVLSEDAAHASLRATTAPVVLVGHSHVALALVLNGNGVAGGLAPAGAEVALPGERWLLNPGSVGQPRDGDPRAAWLLLDLAAGFGRYFRVAYPVQRTQGEIRAAGLPEALAARLAVGQ